MRFYLGTHRPHWLGLLGVPLFVSHRTLRDRRGFPRALAPWGLDSGGFTELSMHGRWVTPVDEYVDAAATYQREIGSLEFAAPQDWMCEPQILERTGLSVREHQERTVANYLELASSGLPFIPVLQGWTLADYVACVDLYADAGIDLYAQPLVGLGSVCRRQAMSTAEEIVVALRPLRVHGFGMKVTGLRRYGYLLASSDSMAWSFGGRLCKPDLHPEREHRACANCSTYALRWRERVLSSLDYQQTHLGFA